MLKKTYQNILTLKKNIISENGFERYNITYNFEIDNGSAQITIENFGSSEEYLSWNNIMQHHIDKHLTKTYPDK